MAQKKLLRVAVGVVGLSALALAGCSDDNDVSGAASSVADQAGSAAEDASAAASSAVNDATNGDLELSEGYCKATGNGSEMGNMTGCFGTLENHTDKDINVVKVTSDDFGGDTRYEMHEVAGGVMKEVEGGFVIPANSEFVMEPGSYHIMLMDLDRELNAGEEYTLTFHADSDGEHSDYDFTVPVREQASGEEDYQ